jgi:hypothetical protein
MAVMSEAELSKILVNADKKEEFDIVHEGTKYHFVMRELPWVRVTQLMSSCFNYEGKRVKIDKSEFDIRYLEEALVEAPWDIKQTRIYLKMMSNTFGEKLGEHLPDPDVNEDDGLKKGSA